MTVAQSYDLLIAQESDKLLDTEQITQEFQVVGNSFGGKLDWVNVQLIVSALLAR